MPGHIEAPSAISEHYARARGASPLVTGRQITAARALLGWRAVDLARASGLHRRSVDYWTAKTKIVGVHANSAPARMQMALEKAGLEFTNHGGPGVRLVRE